VDKAEGESHKGRGKLVNERRDNKELLRMGRRREESGTVALIDLYSNQLGRVTADELWVSQADMLWCVWESLAGHNRNHSFQGPC
jgi:hypothetical protein